MKAWVIGISVLAITLIIGLVVYYIYEKKEGYVTLPAGRMNSPDKQKREDAWRAYYDCLTMCQSIHPTGFVDGKEVYIDTMGILRYECISKCEDIVEQYTD